jgi:hypothetical protein
MKGIKQIRVKLQQLEESKAKLENTRLRVMSDGIEAHIIRDKINLLKWVLDESEYNYPERRMPS